MALYTISDLHLGFNVDKPMDIFGEAWKGHTDKIKKNWISTIKEDDMVLIGGDISWSLKSQDSVYDLEWINELPGKKIIGKGNHDFWWSSITKMNKMYENTKFLQNNFYEYNEYAICGTRGWICPNSSNFTDKDEKIYKRELIRLKLSLESAKSKGYSKIIVMMHYPPVNDKFEESDFIKIYREFNVEKVIYGHLHGPVLKGKLFQGKICNIEYILASADYIDFQPIKLLD